MKVLCRRIDSPAEDFGGRFWFLEHEVGRGRINLSSVDLGFLELKFPVDEPIRRWRLSFIKAAVLRRPIDSAAEDVDSSDLNFAADESIQLRKILAAWILGAELFRRLIDSSAKDCGALKLKFSAAESIRRRKMLVAWS